MAESYQLEIQICFRYCIDYYFTRHLNLSGFSVSVLNWCSVDLKITFKHKVSLTWKYKCIKIYTLCLQ